jgi:hypothetical protein
VPICAARSLVGLDPPVIASRTKPSDIALVS